MVVIMIRQSGFSSCFFRIVVEVLLLAAPFSKRSSALAALRQIAEQYTDTFQMWRNYRDAVPYMQQLKELTTQRILHSTAAEPYAELPQLEEIVRLVTERTVDMLMGSMKSEITPELVRQSCAKIKDRGRF